MINENLNGIQRRLTRSVKVGSLTLGGGNPIRIQSMTNAPSADKEASLAQALALKEAGCEIVRLAVNSAEAVKTAAHLAEKAGLPIVADIHFDYKLAIEAANAGVSKIRINPGNIGSAERVKKLVAVCLDKKVPIRIGINSGSLEKALLEKYGGPTAEALAESALLSAELLEGFGFGDIVLSVKSSDVLTMIKANRLLSEKSDYPLHLGVTETGTKERGSIKSAIGIGSLLADGIGDTLRVSLSDKVVEEVKAAKNILYALKLRKGINLISCPTCGRTEIDLIGIASRLQSEIDKIKTDEAIDVALMGCIVNGPGEAREADVGAAGAGKDAVIFRHGEVVRRIREEEILPELLKEIDLIIKERKA